MPRMLGEYLDRVRGRGCLYDANPDYVGGLLGADEKLVRAVVDGAELADSPHRLGTTSCRLPCS